MFNLIWCEYTKLKHSKILFAGILSTLIVPFFVIITAVINCLMKPGTDISLFSLYDSALMFLMLLSAPIILTILGTWIISREYTDGTLKNIFAIPISRSVFLTGKLLFLAILSILFMAVSWLEILLFAYFCSFFFPVSELTVLSALFFLMKMLLGGILLFATQTPFIYLTVRTKGFAAPLIAITAVSLINVVLSNSPIAGFYPWAASYLLVNGRISGSGCSKTVSIIIILILCLLGIAASLLSFQKTEQ